jgi:hypothetical protein
MVLKQELLKSIPLHTQALNCGISVCELEGHLREKGLSMNWLTKLGPTKKLILQVFLVTYLKVLESNPHFPMPYHPTTKRQNKTPLG